MQVIYCPNLEQPGVIFERNNMLVRLLIVAVFYYTKSKYFGQDINQSTFGGSFFESITAAFIYVQNNLIVLSRMIPKSCLSL
jgi:hypothetical protein